MSKFHAFHVARAASRSHRPCRTHGAIRQVCPACVRVYCPKCPPHDCNPPAPRLVFPVLRARGRPRTTPPPPPVVPSPEIRPLWSIVQPLGACAIEPQDDGHYVLRFPLTAFTATHSEDFKMALLKLAPSLTMLVTITGSGKDITPKPGTWYLRVRLR